MTTAPEVPTQTQSRRRFAAALVFFAAWLVFLVGLAVTDARVPMERAGAVPEADRPVLETPPASPEP